MLSNHYIALWLIHSFNHSFIHSCIHSFIRTPPSARNLYSSSLKLLLSVIYLQVAFSTWFPSLIKVALRPRPWRPLPFALSTVILIFLFISFRFRLFFHFHFFRLLRFGFLFLNIYPPFNSTTISIFKICPRISIKGSVRPSGTRFFFNKPIMVVNGRKWLGKQSSTSLNAPNLTKSLSNCPKMSHSDASLSERTCYIMKYWSWKVKSMGQSNHGERNVA